MMSQIRTVFLVFACAAVFVASGCIETSMLYHGNLVSPEDVITMQESVPQAGTWETFDLRIAYKYIIDGDVFEITGEADLGEHQQMVYDQVNFLYIYLFFLDEDSRVLETVSLDTTTTGSPERSIPFSRFDKIPTGATAFSFGYDGKVSERDGRMPFYYLPLNKK